MRKIRKVIRSNHNDLFNYFIYDEKCLSKKYVSKCVLFLDNLNKKKVGRKKKDNSKNGDMFTNCRSCNTDLSGWRSNKDTRYCVDCF